MPDVRDIWVAVFEGKPAAEQIPHPDAEPGMVDNPTNFVGWVRVSSTNMGEGTQREIGWQVTKAVRQHQREDTSRW